MKFIGTAITAVACLGIGFFAGQALKAQQTIATIEIANDSGQSLSSYEIATAGATLESGKRQELLYGMRGEAAYTFKGTLADGSTVESAEVYVSGGDRQTITLDANKQVQVAPAP